MKTRAGYLAAAAEWIEKAEDVEATPRSHLAKHYAAIAQAMVTLAAMLPDEPATTSQAAGVNDGRGTSLSPRGADEAPDKSKGAVPNAPAPAALPLFMRDYPDNILWGTQAYHNTGDLTREAGGFFAVCGETRHEWIGNWVEGLGFINVRFPKHTSRALTAEERKLLAKSKVVVL